MAKGGFPGGRFPGGGNMSQMIKKAQKMQEEMKKAQDALAEAAYEASVGGGAVCAKVSGEKKLLSLTIAREAVDPDDVEMLEDLVISAVNEAMSKADKAAMESMGKLTGGMDIAGLF